MREILFRGLRVDNDEWVEGFYIYDTLYQFDAINNGKGEFYRVRPETVGQFTGLTDKSGVRIFEGDVVKIYKNKAQVMFQQGSFKFLTKNTNGDFLSWRFYQDEVEVIGNIHENKDLL